MVVPNYFAGLATKLRFQREFIIPLIIRRASPMIVARTHDRATEINQRLGVTLRLADGMFKLVRE